MQQKQQKQRKQKKIQNWIWWVICLVLLIATGAATFAVWKVIKKDEAGQGEQPETVEVNEAVKVANEDENMVNTEEIVEDETNGGKKVKQFEGGDPNKLDYLTGVITTASVSGDNLVIRTNIDQFLSSGSCDLKIMRNNDIIYTETVEIAAIVSTSSCQGFDIPVTAIGTGDVQIIIGLSSGEKTGTINGEAKI